MNNTKEHVTVVVPVYCEEENIRPFYDTLKAVVENMDFDVDVLFVDDRSTDGTVDEIRKLTSSDVKVRALRLSKNFGSLAALTAGFNYATGDAVVAMSVDLQDPPALIPQFVEHWRDGADIVWAVRASRNDPLMKKLFSNFFYRLVRRLIFSDFPKGGMDSGLFDRRVIDIFRMLPERNSSPFFTLYSLGFRQDRIHYDRGPRRAGVSKWPFWRRVKNAIDIIIGFSHIPIRLISLLGVASAAIGGIGALVVIFEKLVLGIGFPGWPSIIITILFVGGVQLLMLGIIAEYIWRLGEQTQARPRYIIAEEVGNIADGHAPSAIDQRDVNVAHYARRGNLAETREATLNLP